MAFTLIELLVVIAIIALLAAMVFPIVGAVNRAKVQSRARAELQSLETAIQAYKAKFGVYPPCDTNNPLTETPLFYELMGTKFSGGVYTTIDGSAQINESAVPNAFGANIGGFFNCARGGDADERQGGVNFLKGGLKAGQFLEIKTHNDTVCTVLGTVLDGPLSGLLYSQDGRKINAWRYNSAAPTNNPSSYDLWIDVMISGKTNRICNWSSQSLIVN